MIILDSNIWIAFFHYADNQHQKAEKIIKKLNAAILIPEYVAIEVASVLCFKANKEIANNFLENISDNNDIKILSSNELFFNNIVNDFINYSANKLSFVDISLLYLSENYKVLTLDKNLQRAIEKKLCSIN